MLFKTSDECGVEQIVKSLVACKNGILWIRIVLFFFN